MTNSDAKVTGSRLKSGLLLSQGMAAGIISAMLLRKLEPLEPEQRSIAGIPEPVSDFIIATTYGLREHAQWFIDGFAGVVVVLAVVLIIGAFVPRTHKFLLNLLSYQPVATGFAIFGSIAFSLGMLTSFARLNRSETITLVAVSIGFVLILIVFTANWAYLVGFEFSGKRIAGFRSKFHLRTGKRGSTKKAAMRHLAQLRALSATPEPSETFRMKLSRLITTLDARLGRTLDHRWSRRMVTILIIFFAALSGFLPTPEQLIAVSVREANSILLAALGVNAGLLALPIALGALLISRPITDDPAGESRVSGVIADSGINFVLWLVTTSTVVLMIGFAVTKSSPEFAKDVSPVNLAAFGVILVSSSLVAVIFSASRLLLMIQSKDPSSVYQVLARQSGRNALSVMAGQSVEETLLISAQNRTVNEL